MKKRLILLLCISGVLGLPAYSQKPPNAEPDEALQRLALLSELRVLAFEVPKLDGSLARAVAQAEIADAAWFLDRDWAKKILREAYQSTYPTDEEQGKFQPEPPGTAPKQLNAIGLARRDVRKRILSVARRDKAFADQLVLDSSSHLTKDDRQMMHSQLALIALGEGDKEAAVRSIQQSIDVDPTQIVFVQLVNDLATKDREAADKLILQCIGTLSNMQLSERNLSSARVALLLRWLVFPNSFFPDPNRLIPGPGSTVMRAYVSYVIESLSALEQREPGSLRHGRPFLLSAWLPLNAHAPELKERFMQLEALSRTPGKDAALPTESNVETNKQDNDTLTTDQPNELSIRSLLEREEFDKARTFIGKLPDGNQKTQLTEQLNIKQALSFVKKGELLEAQSLAERLTQIGSILQVYPVIVERYATDKDQTGASAAVHQAMRQLKNIGPQLANATSFGLPADYVRSVNAADALLWSLGKLAKAVVPVDSLLAAEVVDEMVGRANAIQIDTTQGRTGFESDVFTKLSAKDEIRARGAAENLKARLQRIVALAAVYQWKAKELEKASQAKAARAKRPTSP